MPGRLLGEFATAGLSWDSSELLYFSYDGLDRLVGVSPAAGSPGYVASYGYDASGNLTAKTENGASQGYTYGAQSASCPAGALARPQAVVSAGASTFCYDANGSLVERRGGQAASYAYDGENRLLSATVGGVTVSYAYDGDGHLARRSGPEGTTYYYSPAQEVAVAPGGAATLTKYYFFGGRRVAARAGSGVVTFSYQDQLGSTMHERQGDANSSLSSTHYYPYGTVRTGTLNTRYWFAGQPRRQSPRQQVCAWPSTAAPKFPGLHRPAPPMPLR